MRTVHRDEDQYPNREEQESTGEHDQDDQIDELNNIHPSSNQFALDGQVGHTVSIFHEVAVVGVLSLRDSIGMGGWTRHRASTRYELQAQGVFLLVNTRQRSDDMHHRSSMPCSRVEWRFSSSPALRLCRTAWPECPQHPPRRACWCARQSPRDA